MNRDLELLNHLEQLHTIELGVLRMLLLQEEGKTGIKM